MLIMLFQFCVHTLLSPPRIQATGIFMMSYSQEIGWLVRLNGVTVYSVTLAALAEVHQHHIQ